MKDRDRLLYLVREHYNRDVAAHDRLDKLYARIEIPRTEISP